MLFLKPYVHTSLTLKTTECCIHPKVTVQQYNTQKTEKVRNQELQNNNAELLNVVCKTQNPRITYA